MTALESRKRPSLPFSDTIDDSNGGPADSKSQRPESPRKRPRPRSSGRFHNSVKDLRSHRIFSPDSELYADMVTQKLGFKLASVDSEEAKADEQIGRGIQKGTEVSIEKLEKISVGNDSKTKSFIRPCVRQKLFIPPGSLSYKRLLPYLSEKNPLDKKLDKGLEDKKLQTMESGVKVGSDVDYKSVECSSVLSENGEIKNPDLVQSLSPRDSVANDSELETLTPLSEIDEGISLMVQDGGSKNTHCASSVDGFDKVELELPEDSEPPVLIVLNQVENQNEESNQMTPSDTEIFVKRRSDELELSENTEQPILIVLNQVRDQKEESNQTTPSDTKIFVKRRSDELELSENTEQPVLSVENQNEESNQTTPSDTEIFVERRSDELDLSKNRELPVLNGVNQVDNQKEELNQMTPPNTEIFVEREEERREAETVDIVMLNKEINVDLSNGVSQAISGSDSKRRHCVNSKRGGAVLNPLSRTKLFRSPGSFSYRRMLPFLMDIAKDNLDAKATIQLKKTPENDSVQPTLLSNIGLDQNNPEHASFVKPMPVPTEKKNLISLENGNDIRIPTKVEKEESLLVKELASDSNGALHTPPSIQNSTELRHDNSLTVSEISEAFCDQMKSVAEDKPCEPFSQFDSPVPSRTFSGGLKRGILRSNPRGCRGLCTCLNCDSFRLNADRAFEFSRNQMEDTEELVLGLVDELSYLRSVLEKSVDSVHDHHITHVKEACKKASEAEEAAKNRLKRMNEDLGVHCRTTCVEGPRVKFASRIVEHITASVEPNVSVDEVQNEEMVSQASMIGKNFCTIV